MQTWMIEGHWSGPKDPAGDWTRVVHREYTTSRHRAQRCGRMGPIEFTDGTTLMLAVKPISKGPRAPQIPGYAQLINECLHWDVCSVRAVEAARKKALEGD